MKPVAFVAGATGYTGREVVRALREHDVVVHAHVRPDSARLDDWRRRFAAIGALTDSTPWEPAAITATLQRLRPTHVFALLGTTRTRTRTDPGASYESVDYGLTHTLLAATAGVAPDALFVYLSALGARASARNPYLAVRGRIERELRERGVRHLIARPAFISGPDRDEPRPVERLAARITDAALRVARAAGARNVYAAYASMSGRELGDGLVALALAGRTGVVGPQDLRAEDSGPAA